MYIKNLKIQLLNITKKTKKDCKNRSLKDMETYPRKKKKMKKKNDMGMTDIKICLKTKKQSLVEYSKNKLKKGGKMLHDDRNV